MIRVVIPYANNLDEASFSLTSEAPTYWSELYFYLLVQALKNAREQNGCIIMESGNPLTDASDLVASLGSTQAAIFTALDTLFGVGGGGE